MPDSFIIDQLETDYVDVAITLQNRCIYTTRIYGTASGVATFYELRQIVEQNMISRGLTLASFEVSVDYGGGGEEYDNKYIIFSRYGNASYYNIDFLESHFLVNRSHYVVPRNKYASIGFFATEEEQFTAYYDCVFERDGEIWTYRLEYSMYHYNRPDTYYIMIAPNSVKSLVDNEEQEDCGRLLSFTVHVGSRSMTVYVVDEEPCNVFSFRNSYNAFEYMFVMGTTTFKTEISRKEAVTQNITSFYDKSVTRKWQVKTVPLTMEEAMWYNEFLESHDVTMDINQDYSDMQILITDITSEISDSSKELIHIKFTWRFDDNNLWLDEDRFPQSFTEPFNDTFH